MNTYLKKIPGLGSLVESFDECVKDMKQEEKEIEEKVFRQIVLTCASRMPQIEEVNTVTATLLSVEQPKQIALDDAENACERISDG